jgi:hypothetical protein
MQEKVINNLLFKFQLVITWVKIPDGRPVL